MISHIASDPSEHDAATFVRAACGEEPRSVRRFSTGLAHFVYDVVTASGRNVVARMTRPAQREAFRGAVYWSQLLRPRGVPLPALLASDLDARFTPFPALLLERLPGTDLGAVYATLTFADKQRLATQIAAIQRRVGALPHGRGFGYVTSYDDTFHARSWGEVVYSSLERSHARMTQAGIIDPQHVQRVENLIAPFNGYFARVPPQPFLDDTTTKNVIVHNGQLSGIVDVDVVCFGDPLFTVGLTQMALLNLGCDTDYIALWCDALRATDEQRHVVQAYTALFCVDFLSEIGHAFNKAQVDVDHHEVAKLEKLLNTLM